MLPKLYRDAVREVAMRIAVAACIGLAVFLLASVALAVLAWRQ